MIWRLVFLILTGMRVGAAEPVAPSPEAAETWLARARDAEARGLIRQAIEHAGRATALAPSDPRGFYLRAQLCQQAGQWREADADLGRVLELRPAEVRLYYERGIVRLHRGDFAGSVADLDRFAEARPGRAADLWQRGIALYYVGRMDEARKQFEAHRVVNPRDVENSAWHFACVAQLEGFAAARRKWMPVEGDPRVPMAAIQDLMAGRGSVEAVDAAVEAVDDPRWQASARFYGDLYLALYHDAEGRRDLAARRSAAAAQQADRHGVMGSIARLHVDWLAARLSRPAA